MASRTAFAFTLRTASRWSAACRRAVLVPVRQAPQAAVLACPVLSCQGAAALPAGTHRMALQLAHAVACGATATLLAHEAADVARVASAQVEPTGSQRMRWRSASSSAPNISRPALPRWRSTMRRASVPVMLSYCVKMAVAWPPCAGCAAEHCERLGQSQRLCRGLSSRRRCRRPRR